MKVLPQLALALFLASVSGAAFAQPDFCSAFFSPAGVDRLHASQTVRDTETSNAVREVRQEILAKIADYQANCDQEGGTFEGCGEPTVSVSRSGSAAFRRVFVTANARVRCNER